MHRISIRDFEEHEIENVSGNIVVLIKLEVPAFYMASDFTLHSTIRGVEIAEPLGLFETFKPDNTGYFDMRENIRIVNKGENLFVKLSANGIKLSGWPVLYYDLMPAPKHKTVVS